MDLLSLHFRPGRSFGREVVNRSNGNLLLDSLAVGFPSCAEKQHPSFAVFASFFFQPTTLMSLCHLRFLLKARETAACIVPCLRAETSKFRKTESPQVARATAK